MNLSLRLALAVFIKYFDFFRYEKVKWTQKCFTCLLKAELVVINEQTGTVWVFCDFFLKFHLQTWNLLTRSRFSLRDKILRWPAFCALNNFKPLIDDVKKCFSFIHSLKSSESIKNCVTGLARKWFRRTLSMIDFEVFSELHNWIECNKHQQQFVNLTHLRCVLCCTQSLTDLFAFSKWFGPLAGCKILWRFFLYYRYCNVPLKPSRDSCKSWGIKLQ